MTISMCGFVSHYLIFAFDFFFHMIHLFSHVECSFSVIIHMMSYVLAFTLKISGHNMVRFMFFEMWSHSTHDHKVR